MLIVCPHCHKTNRVPVERLSDQPICGVCQQALLSDTPIALDDATFNHFVTNTELPVVVDYWAPWCGPCQAMAPMFAEAAKLAKGEFIFAKVNTEENPKLSVSQRIRSIPTLAVFQGGVETRRTSGAMAAPDLLRWLRQR